MTFNTHTNQQALVICVGNKLMLDDGIGPAAFEMLTTSYFIPTNVKVVDAGCLSLDMVNYVRDFDLIICVDAVDNTNEEPGTVFRFMPEEMARRNFVGASAHDCKLIDLFDAAMLLGYQTNGVCFGMQVENMSPAQVTIGLTPKVFDGLNLLVQSVAAELQKNGFEVRKID